MTPTELERVVKQMTPGPYQVTSDNGEYSGGEEVVLMSALKAAIRAGLGTDQPEPKAGQVWLSKDGKPMLLAIQVTGDESTLELEGEGEELYDTDDGWAPFLKKYNYTFAAHSLEEYYRSKHD